MFPNIEFNKSAFKHRLTEAGIRYAMWHPLHEQLLETLLKSHII